MDRQLEVTLRIEECFLVGKRGYKIRSFSIDRAVQTNPIQPEEIRIEIDIEKNQHIYPKSPWPQRQRIEK
jgi:hypothetical protein